MTLEASSNPKSSPNRVVVLIVVVMVLGLLVVFALRGAGRTSSKATQPTRPVEEPWQKALAALRKDSDVESCRRILLDLNSDLVKAPNAPQPSATSPQDLATTQADYGWNPAELNEITNGTYSALDAAYLAEALYLRDVATSLNVSSLPPAQRANAAFQWVCRQVVLNEPKPNTQSLTPLPATYVLKRGSGSGLERAYVFIELCRQLNVDAYFVGPPEAKTKPPGFGRDPFWAVGTRAGNQVLLFDPWNGEALPFNLEELRGTSEKALAWAKPLNLTADSLKSAELFLAIPLNAWASRWKPLEEKLDTERGLKLTANRETLLKNAANAAKGAPVSFWHAGSKAESNYSLPRTLAYVLSQLEGGFGENHPSGKSLVGLQYNFSLIQGGLFPLPAGVAFEELGKLIQNQAIGYYAKSFLNPPMPRERFQRGQYSDASRLLVKEWEEYTKMAERDRGQPDRQKAIADWVERANRVYSNLNGALSEEAKRAAQAELQQFWKSQSKGLELITEQSLGTAGTAEAIYLLALCKQENAEHLTGPGVDDPSKLKSEARDAWLVANDWWKRYRDFAVMQDRQYPGRKVHAEALAARAGRMVGANPENR